MDVCELAATGLHQGVMFGVATAVIAVAAIVLRRFLKTNSGFKLGAVGIGASALLLALPTQSALAKTAIDCPLDDNETEQITTTPNDLVDDDEGSEQPSSPVVAVDAYAPYGPQCAAIAPADLSESESASTSVGVIDWSTVDLDPETEGIQQFIDTGSYIASVNDEGVFYATGPLVTGLGEFSVPFTVMNNLGDVSNVAYIIVTPTGPMCL